MDTLMTNLAIRVPTDHHVDSPLRILPELGGRHSRKTAASTGRFPPTPKPKQEYNAQVLVSRSVLWTFNDVGSILPNPVRPTASRKAEYTTDAKCHVERRTSTNSIGSNTPEGGTNNQTREEGASRKTRIGLRDAEFHGKRGQGEGNSLDLVS